MGGRIWTDALREVRKTLSRFFSLFLLSALAVAFLAGLRTTAPDMEYSADAYFDSQGLMDLRVLSTLGLTSGDVDALAAQPGIASAEGSYTVDATLRGGDSDVIVKVHSLSERGFNTPVLVEGRMPQGAGECLAEPALLAQAGLALGDTITLDTGSGDYAGALCRDTFTIVGTAQSPLYISVERGSSSLGTGTVDAFVLLPMSSFSMDSYTEAYLRAEGTEDLACYGDAYQDQIDALTDTLDPIADQRAQLRYNQVVEDAQAQVDDARAQFNDAQAEVDQELSDARAELFDARSELDDGWAEYNDGQATLDRESADAWQQIADGEAELEDARSELEQGELDYADGAQALEEGWAEYWDGVAELSSGLTAYQDGKAELNNAQAELDDGYQQLLDGEQEYNGALQALLDGEQEYADGLAQYRAGLLEIRENAPAIMEARQELEDARQQLLEGEWALAEGQAQLDQKRAEYEQGLPIYQAAMLGAKVLLAMDTLTDGEFIAAIEGMLADPALLNAAMAIVDAARTQLAGQREELDTQLTQLDQLLALPVLTQEERLGLQEQHSALLGQQAALEEQLAGIEAELSRPDLSEEERAQLEAEYTGITGEQQSLGQQLAQLELALSVPTQEQRPALEAKRNQLAQGIDTVDQSLAQLPADAQALTTHLSTLIASYRQMQAAPGQLADAQAQLEQGIAQLQAGWAEYQSGLEQFDAGLRVFEEGVAAAQSAAQQLIQAREELDEGWGSLMEGRVELDESWLDYDQGRLELEDGWDELANALIEIQDGRTQLVDARKQLLEGGVELMDARRELDDGWEQYREGWAELSQNKADLPGQLADAQRELDDARITLLDGEREYADGLADYKSGEAEAESELADARRELDDAQEEIDQIEPCEWYVLGRNANTGYVSFQQDAQRMGNLASVFPVIFFLVAALVCLTTMTRMVEEQRLQIGCLKALGYGKGAIALKYVGYGFLASLLGGGVGLALGCTGIPLIIFSAWRVLYTMGGLVLAPAPLIALLSLGAAVFCVTGTAFAACFAALSASPAALMRPKAPPAGKRVLLERLGPVWRRLSFTYKVTVRNLFRYKKRFWMTVMGIGGCTALIVTGFGLRDSIFDMLDMQYGEISTYSANVGLSDNLTRQELDQVTAALDGDSLIAGWTPGYQISLSVESSSRAVDGYLIAPLDPQAFSGFIHLRHRQDGQAVPLPQEGVVLTEKLAALLDVEPGDTVVLAGDRRVEAPVADITENYVFHYVYLSPSAYQALYGEAPEGNTLMVTYTQDTQENADAIAQDLMALPGVTSVSRIQDTRATFTRSMESVDYAVILIIVCAAALAFVVLFNLTNINITERLRELATLKVLGFYDRELAAYVFRENVLLTIFGVLLGLVMGKYLHQWLVLTVEIDMIMFGRSARPASYLYAAVLTLIFSTLVNLAARRRLKGIDMVESLKTVE